MEMLPKDYGPKRATLVVLEDGEIRCYRLSQKKEWSFGRQTAENTPDVPMRSQIVSRQHGIFFNLSGEWYYRDEGSFNGTWHNGKKLKMETGGKAYSVKLADGDIIRIDSGNLEHPDGRGVYILFAMSTADVEWKSAYLRKEQTLFGRDPKSCDICIPLPYISSKHMIITRRGDKFYLKDCGSMAGTWLNNQKISGERMLHEKDQIALCDCIMVLSGNHLIYNVPRREPISRAEVVEQKAEHSQKSEEKKGVIPNKMRMMSPVIIRADIQSKIVPNSNGHGTIELLRDIHVEVREGTLVALLGGSGAGKTTVMNCMNGMDTRGVKGMVEFQGVDLLRNFERMKHLIGSVPQREVFHESLRVEEELREAAILRLPRDTGDQEIQQHVDRTIRQLGLEAIRKNRISTCSGGEKKRVNIAIELVADRRLLCLDEPDAALDPGMKRELFRILQNLAHKEGKSILVIIHDVSEIDLFDQVIMMAKVNNVGRLAFSGTPQEARKYFGHDIKDAYELLKTEPEKYVQ